MSMYPTLSDDILQPRGLDVEHRDSDPVRLKEELADMKKNFATLVQALATSDTLADVKAKLPEGWLSQDRGAVPPAQAVVEASPVVPWVNPAFYKEHDQTCCKLVGKAPSPQSAGSCKVNLLTYGAVACDLEVKKSPTCQSHKGATTWIVVPLLNRAYVGKRDVSTTDTMHLGEESRSHHKIHATMSDGRAVADKDEHGRRGVVLFCKDVADEAIDNLAEKMVPWVGDKYALVRVMRGSRCILEPVKTFLSITVQVSRIGEDEVKNGSSLLKGCMVRFKHNILYSSPGLVARSDGVDDEIKALPPLQSGVSTPTALEQLTSKQLKDILKKVPLLDAAAAAAAASDGDDDGDAAASGDEDVVVARADKVPGEEAERMNWEEHGIELFRRPGIITVREPWKVTFVMTMREDRVKVKVPFGSGDQRFHVEFDLDRTVQLQSKTEDELKSAREEVSSRTNTVKKARLAEIKARLAEIKTASKQPRQESARPARGRKALGPDFEEAAAADATDAAAARTRQDGE